MAMSLSNPFVTRFTPTILPRLLSISWRYTEGKCEPFSDARSHGRKRSIYRPLRKNGADKLPVLLRASQTPKLSNSNPNKYTDVRIQWWLPTVVRWGTGMWKQSTWWEQKDPTKIWPYCQAIYSLFSGEQWRTHPEIECCVAYLSNPRFSDKAQNFAKTVVISGPTNAPMRVCAADQIERIFHQKK